MFGTCYLLLFSGCLLPARLAGVLFVRWLLTEFAGAPVIWFSCCVAWVVFGVGFRAGVLGLLVGLGILWGLVFGFDCGCLFCGLTVDWLGLGGVSWRRSLVVGSWYLRVWWLF